MRSPPRSQWIAWSAVTSAHGLLAWVVAAGLAPTTQMIEAPAMQVQLAQVRGGEIAPRPTPPQPQAAQKKPVPPPKVPPVDPIFVAMAPRQAETQPAVESAASTSEPPAQQVAAQTTAPPAAPAIRQGVAAGMDVAAPHGAGKDYSSRLRSWLEAHKTYPKRSRMRREEGVVQVRFVLDRGGHLLDGDVIRTSGFEALDAEVLAMLARSDPFPAAPVHVRGDRIEISAPIEFYLDR